MKLIKPGMVQVIRAANFARDGHWPLGGGWIEQTAACLDAVDQFWREEEHWKARLGG